MRFLVLNYAFILLVASSVLIYKRKSDFIVKMIMGSYLSVLIILFNPWIIKTLAGILPIFVLERFLWPIPFFLVTLYICKILFDKKYISLKNSQLRMLQSFLIVLILSSYIPGEPGKIIDRNYIEFYEFFSSNIPVGSTVISDSETSNMLPALKPVKIYTGSKDTVIKGLDISMKNNLDRVLNADFSRSSFASEIKKFNAEFVVIDKSISPHLEETSLPDDYQRIFDNKSHLIFVRKN